MNDICVSATIVFARPLSYTATGADGAEAGAEGVAVDMESISKQCAGTNTLEQQVTRRIGSLERCSEE